MKSKYLITAVLGAILAIVFIKYVIYTLMLTGIISIAWIYLKK